MGWGEYKGHPPFDTNKITTDTYHRRGGGYIPAICRFGHRLEFVSCGIKKSLCSDVHSRLCDSVMYAWRCSFRDILMFGNTLAIFNMGGLKRLELIAYVCQLLSVVQP